MKIAAFNVENLFERAKAFNKPTVEDAQETLKDTAVLNALFELTATPASRAKSSTLSRNWDWTSPTKATTPSTCDALEARS